MEHLGSVTPARGFFLPSCIVAWLGVLLAVTPLLAARAERGGGVESREFVLHFRQAAETVPMIAPLLSTVGTLEVRVGENALRVRDRQSNLDRVAALVERLDRPGRRFQIELSIVRAGAGDPSMVSGGRLPDALLSTLRRYLRYQTYRLEATAEVKLEEGPQVTLPVGGDYLAMFRLHRVEGGDRVRLEGFRLFRQARDGEPLIHTHVNLWLGKPMILGLARTEESREALMVVLTCRVLNEAADHMSKNGVDRQE